MTKIKQLVEEHRAPPKSNLEENVNCTRRLSELKEERKAIKSTRGMGELFIGGVRNITGLGCPAGMERLTEVDLEMSELEDKLSGSNLH